LEEIIEVAIEDSDQWVSMLAELLKNYPNNGTINFQLNVNSATFNDLVNEIKKIGLILIKK
jgi:negative elongation factor A